MEMFTNYPDILTVSDIQTLLGIGRNTSYYLVKSGKIKSLKIGKKYLIPKQFFIEFIYAKSKGLMTSRDSDILMAVVKGSVNHDKEAC